jgi:hypothetical protein
MIIALDDHRRSPGGFFLRPQDVAVDVIADVDDAVAGDAEASLEIVQVASLVDLAALERERGGAELVAHAFLERPALLEERGLLRGDDDDVEEVTPRRVLGHRAAEQVVHHLVRVRPARVGEQKELAPGAPELVQRRRQIRIFDDEPRQIREHGVEDGAVAVRFVDALANVGEKAPVIDGEAAFLERIDDPGVERRLG